MPTYSCRACRLKFFLHDRQGRACPQCGQLMLMNAPEPVVQSYKVHARPSPPYLPAFPGPKYSGELVLALIDGAAVKWQGALVTEENQRGFLNDMTVPEEVRRTYTRQVGERHNAEDLHGKERKNKPQRLQLRIVQDYEPNSEEQANKIRVTLSDVSALGEAIKLLVVAHSDPDSQRMAGITPREMAGLIGGWHQAKHIQRITLIGCHTAGKADSTQNAKERLGVDSFASVFHQALGHAHKIFVEVGGYTAYIKIDADGFRKTRFDADARHEHRPPGSKVIFYWDIQRMPARRLIGIDESL